MLSKAIDDLRRGWSLNHVWTYQAYHEVSSKYKRTVFGPLWLCGSMIFMSLSFAIVFGALWGTNLRDTLPYIMSGILAYNAISYILIEAPETYMFNSGIIRNHAYPFTYYTFEAIAKNIIQMGYNIIAFELVMVALQFLPHGAAQGQALSTTEPLVIPHWSFIIGLPMVCLNMFTWGALVSLLSSRFRDMRFLIPYVSTVVMFMMPIMYRKEQLKGMKLLFVELNPMYPFVEMLRSPLRGEAMPLDMWPMAIGVSVVGIILWIIFFAAFRKRIPFWV
jgi:ABC-2 type transport system permease protein/lipopolysaccharide transport system permease protein